MNRQREAARTAALFLSFTAFFMTSPLTLWDAGLFAQISASRAVEVSVINGLTAMGTALAIGAGLWSMTRESPRVGPAVAVTGGAAYIAGGLAYVVVQTLSLPVGAPALCAIGLAMGFGSVTLTLGWCRVLCPFGLKRSLLGMAMACAMGTLVELGFAVGLLPALEGAFVALLVLGAAAPV